MDVKLEEDRSSFSPSRTISFRRGRYIIVNRYQGLGRQEQGGDTAYVVMEIVLGQSLLPVFPLFLGGDCLVGELTSGENVGLIV